MVRLGPGFEDERLALPSHPERQLDVLGAPERGVEPPGLGERSSTHRCIAGVELAGIGRFSLREPLVLLVELVLLPRHPGAQVGVAGGEHRPDDDEVTRRRRGVRRELAGNPARVSHRRR